MAGLLKKLLKKDQSEKKGRPFPKAEKKASQKPSLSAPVKSPKPVRPLKEEKADVYRFIQSAHITEKAGLLAEQNKYVFRVYPKANKPEVKKSIESLYGVKVESVRIIHCAPKKMRLGKREGFKGGLKKGFKKAIVTLKEGDKIESSPR